MNDVKSIALKNLNITPISEGEVTPEIAAGLLAEFANAGIKITNPENINDSLLKTYKSVIRSVKKLKGEKTVFTPLFTGFPDKLPAIDDAELRFALANMRLQGLVNPTDDEIREAMDFSDANWWPASSVPQDEVKTIRDRQNQTLLANDTHKVWFNLKLVTEEEFDAAAKSFVKDAFKTPTSLRSDIREDVEFLARRYGVEGITLEDVPFRETRVLLLKFMWEQDVKLLPKSKATPTDVLRLFADLSELDVSLASAIKYPKLSRLQRRSIVNTLENSSQLNEIFKYRDLWLHIDKGLHLGEFKAPKAQKAFAELRKTRHDKTSILSKFEETFKTDAYESVKITAAVAPGLLFRNFRRILAKVEQEKTVTETLTIFENTTDVSLKILLNLKKQVQDNGLTYPRLAFTKTGDVKHVNNASGHLQVKDATKKAALKTIDALISKALQNKASWVNEKIYIDPSILDVLLPFQMRSTSNSLKQIERGTRLPVDTTKTIRMFTHWKESGQRTDLDLSSLVFDKNFKVTSQVSYTNLRNSFMTHSGDITSAPQGAEEFIDISIKDAKASMPNARYIAPVIYRFSGDTFVNLEEASAGWMIRDKTDSSKKTFDVSTVENVFDLVGTKACSVPFLLDLETDTILYVDLYTTSTSHHASVETTQDSLSSLLSSVVKQRVLLSSVEEFVLRHVKDRGGKITKVKKNATISFGPDDSFTFNVLKPEKLLTELL